MSEATQRILDTRQIEAFHHDEFVTSQAKDFLDMVPPIFQDVENIVDIGGGCGYFAEALQKSSDMKVRVVDLDPASVALCAQRGVQASVGDAISPDTNGNEEVICFNLILHHLVSDSEKKTERLQSRALEYWRNDTKAIFINEYIYYSYFYNASGKIIYLITSSKSLSFIAGLIGKIIPSLRANTLGVGVRFRSHDEWLKMFDSLGFKIISYRRGPEETVSLARRMLMIASCRRDSFLISARGMPQ